MEEKVLNELKQIKQLTLLQAKTALTMEDMALLSGLSKSHLYKMVCAKQIPYYKTTKLIYFDKDEVTKWLLQRRVSSTYEIEQQATTYCVTGKKGGAK